MTMNIQTTQKIVIISGLFACTVSDGYIVGQTSGMVAAQQNGHSDVPLNDNQMSWVASASNMTTVLGLALAALVTEKLGRRKTFTILTMPVVTGWVAIYLGQHMWVFMMARIIHGICFGGLFSLCVLSTGEYTAPNARGIYLNLIITAGAAVGVAVSNVLGTLIHWRTVAIIGVIPAIISALLPYFWVESPTWLASKGRFEECAESFKSLHGTGKEASEELRLLIKVETEKQKISGGASESAALIWRKISTALKQRYIWKIAALSVVLHLYRVATARLLICTFAITILQNITGSTDIFLFSLVADGCLVIGSILSSFMIDRIKCRALLFLGGIAANVVLIVLSISLYYFGSNPWLNCALLALFIVIVNAGPYPVLESLFGEIYPLEIKCYCMFGFGIIGTALLFVSTKLSLTMFAAMGYHGVFLFHAGLGFLCLGYFYVFLPETKGRTLQEIELYFKNNKFDDINYLLREEQMARLV